MKFYKAIFFLLLISLSARVFSQSSDDLKRDKKRYMQELEQLNREYEETSNNKKVSLKQLSILKEKIAVREKEINNINSQLRGLDNQILETTNSVHNLQNQLQLLKNEYAAMVIFTYHNQSSYNKLMFIFAAKDFNQSYKRLKYLQQIGTYRERQAKYIQAMQAELGVKLAVLDKSKKDKSNLLSDQKKEKENLGKEKNVEIKVVAELSKHQGILKQQQKEVQRKIAKTNRAINLAIKRDIEEARRKDAAANPSTITSTHKKPVTNSEVLNSTPESVKLSNNFLENRGSLPWPVTNGDVKQGFGRYRDELGIENESFGWDIRTNAGSSVRAVFEGEVKQVQDISGTFLVLIKHGEYYTAYSILKSTTVKAGQKISTKQIIGTVATDQTSGEAVVTFSIYKVDVPVNPKIWLTSN
jgi:septal ring factor EnvC (AmiA/AmiB activator)